MAMKYGKDHHNWRGDNVGYQGIHAWINKRFPKKDRCSNCGIDGKTDLANVDHKYSRELRYWIELCRKCHMEYDPGNGFKKGYTPWNKGKKGIRTNKTGGIPWNKGMKNNNQSDTI